MNEEQAAYEEIGRILRAERHGVLCSAHSKHGGWPFGSVTPYALTATRDPVIYLSEIAEHTRNLAADPRATLLVQERSAQEDPQAGGRIALMGRCAVPADPREAAAALETYLERQPAARAYAQAHGFSPFVLRVERVRWILGFGRMGWLERDGWLEGGAARTASAPGADALAPHAERILAHMNTDHSGALVELARHFARLPADAARMTAVDPDGFAIEVEREGKTSRARIAFPQPCPSSDAVRRTLIAMLGEARKAAQPVAEPRP